MCDMKHFQDFIMGPLKTTDDPNFPREARLNFRCIQGLGGPPNRKLLPYRNSTL
jgi:hypothetical protein